MTRETFGTGMKERLGHLFQQRERLVEAKRDCDEVVQICELRGDQSQLTPYWTNRLKNAEASVVDFAIRYEAAENEFVAYLYDFITTQSPAHSPDGLPFDTSVGDANETRVGEREPSTNER